MECSENGHNPLKWDCEKQGCFNKLKRPKIEVFCDCFPGRISFGDVDGIVEINGQGLLLEWKEKCGGLSLGQRIMYEKLTRTGILTVFVIVGNPETMDVEKYCIYFRGKRINPLWIAANLDHVKARIRSWAKIAKMREP